MEKIRIKKLPKMVHPRPGETHGLFGVRFLKHHNMRDADWTAHDLITQYEKLSNIYRKANNVIAMEQERDETENIERFLKLQREKKEKKKALQILLMGDVQRTKNAFQDHLNLQRMFQNKQSHEVLAEMDRLTVEKRKTLDRCIFMRNQLMQQYEERLVMTLGPLTSSLLILTLVIDAFRWNWR